MAILHLVSGELLRFAAVIVVGLFVDLTTAFIVAGGVGLPLPVGAAAGFFAGAFFNYACHELWTFRTAGGALSTGRASLYLVSALVILGVRLLVTTVLSPLAVNRLSGLAVLVAAAGVSFVVNYLLSRFVVYRRTALQKYNDLIEHQPAPAPEPNREVRSE